MSLVVRHGREDAEFGVQVVVDSHDGRYVTAPVAVVGGRPDGNDGFLRKVKLQRVVHVSTSVMSAG